MIIEKIEKRYRQLKNKTKRNTWISVLCGVTAISFFIPAFASKGKIVDYVSVCFQPKEINDPYIYKEKISKKFVVDSKGKYVLNKAGKKKIETKITKVVVGKRFCNEYNTKKVIASFAAEEIENSITFRTKVKVVGKIEKATNPHAGLFGIGSGLLLGVGSLIYWSATKDLENNQDSLIHVKRSKLIDEAFRIEQELDIKQHEVITDAEFLKQGLSEEIRFSYLGDDPLPTEEEITKNQELIGKKELLRDTSIELELTEMKAVIAKKKKEECEALRDLNKINKTIKDKIQDSHHTNDHTNDHSKDQLIKQLKDHEDGWLWVLINSIKPLWVSGDMGSGKSTFATCIALCRHYLIDHKLVAIIDPEFNKNIKKAWSYLSFLEPKVYGEVLDLKINDRSEWIDVNQGLLDSLERWRIDDETTPLKTSIFDEVTQYESQKETKEAAGSLAPLLISKPRKANEAVICIAHVITNKATGGSDGFAGAIKNGTFTIQLKTSNDAKPLFKGILEGYKNEEGDVQKDKQVTIPHEWFNPKSIKEMFKNG